MKQVGKGVGFSLLSPLIVGSVLGIYYSFTLGRSEMFFNLLLSAISNAYIVGLAMCLFVVPGYILMFKYNKVQYSGLLTLGLLGGALFSYLFSTQSGVGFIVNALMSMLAAGLFLFGLRARNHKTE
ncbi:hypothetical protein HUZ36_01255 [Pseudoalteromonas sp. McH1-7]|uniref:Uncharacterized protein n=1 Tax=Pseudoalteromonas peptidolytica F12-50-A1 TaxID=1315280 RepID=A0A8I0MUT5_9GAMM|nr:MULTISPECIES: hypothetical protein [Pseudoalteromonas]MBE0346250.1 hypothetical protein [Pseudoalteromonas peptidolytica F12-50-A1]MDW7548329.1 hypothetical protein [Pseudoalteromonas peptidolytica]NLR14167.1 hypothetical protein [Pseudoalteromonas peptidolytica]NUZ09396.1 hypothetical protein [Pseudoalteromonas sp. McH1-7]RXF02307.1 hypothetical protein D9603_11015 [Pseudoalteromonas sp. PS5]